MRMAAVAVLAVVVVACGRGAVPGVEIAGGSAEVPRCEELEPLAAPSEWYGDEPIYVGNEMPVEELQAWAQDKPRFEDVWIDRDHNGWVALAFSEQAEQRQQELRESFPDAGAVVVPVDWTRKNWNGCRTRSSPPSPRTGLVPGSARRGVGVYGLCAIPLDAYEVIEHAYVPPKDTTGVIGDEPTEEPTTEEPPTEEPTDAPSVSVTDVSYQKKGRHLEVAVSLVGPSGPVAGARVTVDVSRGTTSVLTATVETDTAGVARVRVSHAKAGCYSTDITAVTADGYLWDGLVPDEVWCT